MTVRHGTLVNAVVLELSPLGIAWKNATGVAQTEQRTIRYGLPGSPDIVACIKGRFVGVECKTGSDIVRPNQSRFAAALTAAGGLYIVARSVDDVRDALKLEGLS